MKSSLLFVAILLLAGSAQAQHSHARGASTSSGGGTAWSLGGQLGNTISSRQHALRYEEPRTLTVGYAKNDGEFVPSTYMNYDDALALGKQQLAAEQSAQAGASVSLGEIARTYRNAKTANLQASLVQGNSGKLEVCSLNGSNCRRL